MHALTVERGPEDPQEERAQHAGHVVLVGAGLLGVSHAMGRHIPGQHIGHSQAIVAACRMERQGGGAFFPSVRTHDDPFP
eukprot:1158868-Pelagomonas_calceolata.AAC.2